MNEFISTYIKEINQLYQTGLTTEHSFRPALQRLLHDCTGCTVINEQSHIDCGAPDLTLLSKHLPIAYIEAKDLEDGDLDGRKKNREQFDRYKASLDTIIFTDYLDFHLYEHGEWQQSVRLAEIQGNKIRLSDADRFVSLMEHIKNARPQRITSASKLAQLMAGKARLLRDIIEQALIQDGDNPTELRCYMEDFRKTLLHDITPKKFADIYAQTIAYGMFAARLHDESPDDFSRSEAANLIPKTNPFLRKIFQQIAGFDLDERIAWIVDDLVSAFAATDMEKIMQGFGKETQQTDPILHFYEDFLFQYDPAAKKQCGVYYTPQPVVEFIVRAVDDILRTEFQLPMGLADTSKTEVEQEIPQDPKHRKEKKLVHRVQVLDPATGTGTFLAETVRQIKRDLGEQMGAWPSYVPEHLRPRLFGFELMMAPYTIAHIKLDMEIGVKMDNRLNVYLTNSLEEANMDSGTLFGDYLAQEANAASSIKKESPVMIVMGNPPYSGESQNKSEWIMKLMEDYKKEPGGVSPLKERNPKWINDDYCKFIRLGQYYVDRNKEGVLAYICNNGFLDNPTFRGMRWNLLRSFDKIYIINLHGNSLKKETCPDGSKDENVFDIMVGTSINIFVKTGKKKNLAEVYYLDLYGERKNKYEFLSLNKIDTMDFQKIDYGEPFYFFVPKDSKGEKEYMNGFKINDLCSVNSMGVTTGHDKELVSFSPFSYSTNTRYYYRPFDTLWLNYDLNQVVRPRESIMRNLQKENIALCLIKVNSSVDGLFKAFVTKGITDKTILSSKDNTSVFPLYLYPEEGSIDTSRRPNLDEKIWAQINTAIGKEASPENIFDYIYGVLYSPAYRAKYKEFLKVDFPRIPYPKDLSEFEHFRFYGYQLRELHLMHSVPNLHVTFPESGSMLVEKAEFVSSVAPEWDSGIGSVDSLSIAPESDSGIGIVRINATQYFVNVPREAWDFYIGGYQPAQKWLKDRKGRTLSFDDIEHYRKIISVLKETKEIMEKIG